MRTLSAAAGLLTLSALSLPPLAATALAQAPQTQNQKNLTPQQKAAIEAARKKKAQQQQGAGAQGQKGPGKPLGKPPGKPLVKQVPKTGVKPPPKAVVKPMPKPPVTQQTVQPNAGAKPQVNPQAGQPKVIPQGQQAVDPNKRFRRPLVRRPNPNQPPVANPNVQGKPVVLPTAKGTNPGLPAASKVPRVIVPEKRGQPANLQAIKSQRRQIVAKRGNAVVIKEPDNRTIIKRNNRSMIVHNESNRLKRVAPNARTEKRGRNNVTVIQRANNVTIYNVTDNSGQLVRRYRRDADGREHNIIDNRRHGHKSRWRRNLAIGLGVGAGIVAGAAILNAMVDVPPPRVDIPRDKYIVDYDDADDEEVYEAFSAPPVDVVERRYTLDEVRATPRLRERMRRVDLNDITFETGSWEVDESQYGKLERVARGLKRVIDENPNEVFMIEGYTDAVGDEDDNLTLSDRRAESVAVILSEQFEVPAENLTTQGYGEQYLKVETDGPERANRRVAVRRITPLLSQGEQQGEPQDDE